VKKQDSTKYLRQMVYRPDMVILSSFFIIIFLVVTLLVPWYGYSSGHYYVDFPEVTNDEFEAMDSLPEICIKRDGSIIFDGMIIEDLAKLPVLIEDDMEKHMIIESKILLKIDRDTPFGKVQEVLTLVKKANIETVGLVTREGASAAYLFWTPTK